MMTPFKKWGDPSSIIHHPSSIIHHPSSSLKNTLPSSTTKPPQKKTRVVFNTAKKKKRLVTTNHRTNVKNVVHRGSRFGCKWKRPNLSVAPAGHPCFVFPLRFVWVRCWCWLVLVEMSLSIGVGTPYIGMIWFSIIVLL